MKGALDTAFIDAAREELARLGIDAWLLYDLEARNRVAATLLGLPDGTSRRYFVLLRRQAKPTVLAHSIELGHWARWQGDLVEYVGWRELESALTHMLAGCNTVAMEVSASDAVPFVDYVPAGVVQLVEGLGVRVVSSAALLSRTYAQWGKVGCRTHARAGRILADAARQAFDRAAGAARDGKPHTEYELGMWVQAKLTERGLDGIGTIIATGANSANPHYMPAADASLRLERDGIVLIDLWGRVNEEPAAVFADQTWMGFLGARLPPAFGEAWDAVREARDGAVQMITARAASDKLPTGAEVDAHVRDLLSRRGFGHQILHRTGHGIDRVLHGFGPNLDAVETQDERELVEGIGFSVEPGLYFRGRFGLRSEINVYMRDGRAEVTTPDVQQTPWLVNGS